MVSLFIKESDLVIIDYNQFALRARWLLITSYLTSANGIIVLVNSQPQLFLLNSKLFQLFFFNSLMMPTFQFDLYEAIV